MSVTREDILVKLSLDEKDALQGFTSFISKTKDVNLQVERTISLADQMAIKYGVASKEVARALTTMPETAPLIVPETKEKIAQQYSVRAVESSQLSVLDKSRIQQAKLVAELEKERAKQLKEQELLLKKQEQLQKQSLANQKVGLVGAQEIKARLVETVNLRTKEIQAVKQLNNFGKERAAYEKLIADISKQTGANFEQVAAAIKSAGGGVPQVTDAMQSLENKTRGVVGTLQKQFGNLRNYISTAFGTLTAMILFTSLQKLTELLTGATDAAKKFQQSLREIQLAENVLSQYGVEVTTKDLLDMAERLQEKFTIVPRADVTQLVADLGRGLAMLGLGENLEQVAELALTIKLKNPEKDLGQIQDAINQAIFGGSTKTLEDYGIPITEKMLKDIAVAEGLAKQNEELSAQAKAYATILAIQQAIIPQQEELLKLQKDIAYSSEQNEKAWKDFLEALGVMFAPFIAEWNRGWAESNRVATEGIQQLKSLAYDFFAGLFTMIQMLNRALSGDKSVITNFGEEFRKTFARLREEYQSLVEVTGKDTPTGNLIPQLGQGADDGSEKVKRLRDNIYNLIEALDQFGDRAREAFEKFRTANDRAFQDFQHSQNKINQEANEKIEDANRKFRNKELIDELRFQEQMRQLREKFLFSLEDAVRERDARQILRLQSQYAMDKQALINENSISRRAGRLAHEEELAQIEDDRQAKLEELAYQYELEKQRRAEDFQEEMRQLQDQIKDKLREVSNGIAEELGLNQEGAQAIYDALSQFFGPDGSIEQLRNYTYDSAITSAETALARLTEIALRFKQTAQEMQNQSNQLKDSLNQFPTPGQRDREKSNTEGVGTVPTEDIFGGATVPTNSISNAMASSPRLSEFSSVASRSMMELMVTLGPELESRIVRKSVGEVGNMVARVRRTKV